MPINFGNNEIQNAHFGTNELRQIISKGVVLYKASLRIDNFTGTLSNLNSFGGDAGSISIVGDEGATGTITGSNGAANLGSFTIPAGGTFTFNSPNVSSNQGDARTPTWTLAATGDTVISDGVDTTLSINQSAALAADISINSISTGSVSYSSNSGGWRGSVGGVSPVVYNGAVNPGFTASASGGSQSYSVSYWCSCNFGCQGGPYNLSVSFSKAGYRSVSASASGNRSYRRYGDYSPPLPGSPSSFPAVTNCSTCTANPCYYFEPQN